MGQFHNQRLETIVLGSQQSRQPHPRKRRLVPAKMNNSLSHYEVLHALAGHVGPGIVWWAEEAIWVHLVHPKGLSQQTVLRCHAIAA